MIPGEAHWKLGICEQAIQGTKTVMTKLAEDDPDITASDALAEAVRTFNSRQMIRGYTPIQHALGRAPDEMGRFFPHQSLDCPDLLIENASGEQERNLRRMMIAEQKFLEWTNQQRLVRAQNSRSRPAHKYETGDLVYIWRKQVSGSKGCKTGRFVGPARILTMEKKVSTDGSEKVSSAIWCVRGRRLFKCCPEQLRLASQREQLLEELQSQQFEDWDFHRVAQELGGNEYEDVSEEVPEEPEWHRVQDPRLGWQPTRRCRGKKRNPDLDPEPLPDGGIERMSDYSLEDELEAPRGLPSSSSTGQPVDKARSRSPAPSRRKLREKLLGKSEPGIGFTQAPHWTEHASLQCFFQDSQPKSFWENAEAAVAIEIDMPDTKAGGNRAMSNLEGFLAARLKRRSAIEISEKYLSDEDRALFKSAKAVEVDNFIAGKAFEALPQASRPDKSQAVRMRWILTWKIKEDGSRKAKARAVLMGYQDPLYEHRATTSPTTTRQTRQLQMQIAASLKFKARKGDVSGAFLQS